MNLGNDRRRKGPMTEAVASYKQAKDNHKLNHIPGSFGLPIIGHTISLVKDLYGTVDKQYTQFGPVSKFGLAASRVFSCAARICINRSIWTRKRTSLPRWATWARWDAFIRAPCCCVITKSTAFSVA